MPSLTRRVATRTSSLKQLANSSGEPEKEQMASKEISTPPTTSAGGKNASQHVPPSQHKVAKLVPFLRKVQQLCESAPPHIARWSADGKQFDVLDPKGFDDLLKVHFEGAAPATFHRQLFFYGWVKLNHSNGGGDEKTKGTWSFRHPLFLRDEPSKIYEIKRYARASDREEGEDASRVDILERRVNALQSLVDDLSRKLAAVQLTLDRTPLAVEHPVRTEYAGRKRVKDVEEEDYEFLNESRLSEDEIMQLFDNDDFLMMAEEEAHTKQAISEKQSSFSPASPSLQPSQSSEVEHAPNPIKRKLSKEEEAQQAQQAQEFLSSLMSTPQFQAAITSKTIQDSKPVRKVEVPPHLSVC